MMMSISYQQFLDSLTFAMDMISVFLWCFCCKVLIIRILSLCLSFLLFFVRLSNALLFVWLIQPTQDISVLNLGAHGRVQILSVIIED